MNLVRRNIFAVKTAEPKQPLAISTGSEVGSLIQEARRSGGMLAGWRVKRAADAGNVQLVQYAMEEFFAARREELGYRIALALDAAKKRAIATNLEDTAIIEREIARISAVIDDELTKSSLEIAKEAAREEVRQIRDIEAALARNEITEERFHRVRERIQKRTDDVAERAERIAERVIENLGERLDAALRTTQGNRY
jgi:hypothetical protein